MDLLLIYAIVIIITLLLVVWYKFAYAPYQLFKGLGISHPPVTPFFGNMLQINKQEYMEVLQKWFNKYGKVFGIYIGSTNIIYVADADILKEVMVKQFSKFTDTVKIDRFAEARGKYPTGITGAGGSEWKRLRTIVSPTFSTKKIIAMVPHIERICDSLNDKLKEVSNRNQSIEMWKIFGQFTMETILATSFGHQVNVLKGEEDKLMKAASEVLSDVNVKFALWIETICSQISFFATVNSFVLPYLNITAAMQSLCNTSLQLIQARRQSMEPLKYKDLLQLLIEAKGENNDDLPLSSKTLTDEEIVSICIDFLLAGYETTSNCLAYTSYVLALNADKQNKLCQFIEDFYQENPDANLYDASQNIQYLDWVVSESLRMYSPVPEIPHICTETCTINGLTIPKGTTVNIAIQEVHYCTEYWSEPNVFRPERFSPEEKESRNPLCYMPFGYGPRTCVGMKLGLIEIKMALVSILRRYRFYTAPETEIPLKTTVGISQYPTNDWVNKRLVMY